MIHQNLYNVNTKILRSIFFTAAAKYKEEWRDVFNFVSPRDKRPAFEDISLAEFGAVPVKDPGRPVVTDSLQEAYSLKYTYLTLALGYRATKELMRHDQYNVLKYCTQLMAYSDFITTETRVWNMLNQAFAAGVTGGDAKSLCATDHPLKKGGTYANMVATTAFSVTAFENSKIRMEKIKSDANNFSPKSPAILIGGLDMRRKFKEVLLSPKEPYTTDNQVNIHFDDDIKRINTKWITSSTAWFVLAKKGDTNKNGEVEFSPDAHKMNVIYFWDKEFDSNHDAETQSTLYTMDKRLTYGFSDWRGVDGSQGA